MAIEAAQFIGRIVLTFVPMIMLKNHLMRKMIKYLIKDEVQKVKMEEKIRTSKKVYRFLIAVPIVIFGLTLVSSLERTPLSGRWRVILLSPEEEETISQQLQGSGWHEAIREVISQDGPATIVPETDWRYRLVEHVLRELEKTIPILASEKYADLPWIDRGPDDIPLPPPSRYPLKPRPSAKEVFRWLSDQMCSEKRKTSPPMPGANSPHLIPGPPYNLILVERPECDNAFSFGFGPNGGGGIVVYTGFLNRVLKLSTTPCINENQARTSRSIFSSLRSSPQNSTLSDVSVTPGIQPTQEEYTQIAILLAHELAHLVLSHHLETLSAGTVFIPGAMSMFADLLRAVLFPITMAFGPFVNDAVANLGKVGTGEFAKVTVSLRL